jgi:CheY-like chemotaxis protein
MDYPVERVHNTDPKLKTILILDDNFEIVVLFRTFLTRLSYSVTVSTKPDEALAFVKKQPPDLIITDMSMPGMTGSEFIKSVREDGFEGRIIVITAFPKMADAQAFTQHGVYRCLVKPVFMKKLEETVLEALGDSRPAE